MQAGNAHKHTILPSGDWQNNERGWVWFLKFTTKIV